MRKTTWRDTCQLLDIPVTEAQSRAMDQLERRGYTFCAEFGYENACEMLADLDRKRNEAALAEFDSALAAHMRVQ